MRRRRQLFRRVVIALGSLVLPMPALAGGASDTTQVRARLSDVRLPFISNEGQVDGRVAYYAPTFAGSVFVTRRGEVVYALRGPRRQAGDWGLTETLGGGGRPRPVAQSRSTGAVNAFFGDDPARWRFQLPTWDQVGLGDVWPGVSVALRARGRSVEKVFTVHPGGAVGRIRVRVAGAHALTISDEGALVAHTGLGPVTFTAPVAYQERGGVREPVVAAYRHHGFEYGFNVGDYDPALPLVIDPLLQSTYLGGAGDDVATAMAIHPTTGDVYVAGHTRSTNFPGTTGGPQPATGGDLDVFVARLPRPLTSVTQVTYLGGTGNDVATALAIHPTTGDVYVAGYTLSSNFPGTSGGAQAAFGNSVFNAFIARLPSTLTALTQATYLGGTGSTQAHALAIHPSNGSVYVAGFTDASDFPGTAGGAQSGNGGGKDAFVAQLPSTLTSLTRATYLGGSGQDQASALTIHPTTGDVYVAGETGSASFPGIAGGAQTSFGGAFVARLSGSLTALTRATYLGDTIFDRANALAIHPTTGDVYVAGETGSGTFPGAAGGAQTSFGGSFVARLPGALTSLTQATYLGNTSVDRASALAIHPTTGDVFVAGKTGSDSFPGAAGGTQSGNGGGFYDAFVARLTSTLTSLTQATYLGGSGEDQANTLAIHPTTGEVYVAGGTGSSNFPGTGGGAQPASGGPFDAFIARLTTTLASAGPGPDLTVAKSHTGSFNRGQAGATYTLTVSNTGTAATTGTVTVTDTLPSGLTATALSGPGWSCTLGTLTCTRSDALANGTSYPSITLTVDVAASAPGSVINTGAVTGGGDVNPGNNTASDPTTIADAPDLTISKTHSGNFAQGQVGATYTLTVSNVGPTATSGVVTVTDTLPAGLTATALNGTGWTCTLGTLTCTRGDALANGASYPALTLTVTVAGNAPVSVTNTATVSGGGDVNSSNNTASDPTTIGAGAQLQVMPATNITSSGTQGGPFAPSAFAYQLSTTTGTANFSISGLPSWLTASATSGTATTSATTVTFTVNASANGLVPNTYGPTAISFTNTTNGQGNTSRTATLTVNPPSSLTFTDGSGPNFAISPATTLIKAVHILELRAAINNLRAAKGLSAFSWTDPTLNVRISAVRAIHLLDLRTALAPVCTAVPGKCTVYTEPTLNVGQTVIRAVHLNELRANVLALQ